MKWQWLFILWLASCWTQGIAQIIVLNPSPINEIIDQYECFVESTLVKWQAPGAAVAIVKDGHIAYMKGFGRRHVDKSDSIDVHTVFRIASVSKGFAAQLTALLVRDGYITWEDRVTQYLPFFTLGDKTHTEQLEIRHLLSHTAGVPPHTFDNLLEDNMTYDDIINRLSNVSCSAPVGRYYSYQNVVYSLIGDILHVITGMEYKRLLGERIFNPLGMKDASAGRWDLINNPNHATPHIRVGDQYYPTEIDEAYYKVIPAAGINASISDMAKWLLAQLGYAPDILSPDVIQQIHTPVVKTKKWWRGTRWSEHLEDAYYGLGWRIFEYEDQTLVYHGGWVKGYRAEIAFLPDERVGVAVLLNAEGVRASIFIPTFLDMYFSANEKY